MASASAGSVHQVEDMSDAEQLAEPVQHLILKKLQQIKFRLDAVEGQMASSSLQHSPKHHKSSKLSSTSGYHKKCYVKSS